VNLHERLGLISVDSDLTRLQTVLAQSVIFGDEYLDSVSTHLIYTNGKRLRPMLALASATSGARPATQEDLLGGVAIELMHLASIYHDDVMDEADARRDPDGEHARYGHMIGVVAGDYLMARSATIAAQLGAQAAGLLARTLASQSRGRISEVRTSYCVERTPKNYFDAIEGKTGSLMSASCQMGALTAHLDQKESTALGDYGRCFGVVHQLRDDILDVVATNEQLGRPAGQDLAEGIYNLPTLFALDDAALGDELRSVLGAPLDDEERERARKLVIATDGIAQTIVSAQRFLAHAHEALEGVASEPLQKGFGSLIEFLLEDLPTY
jgi:heptaprenyl diphosphate synthase